MDYFFDSSDFVYNLGIPKPQDREPLCFQPFITFQIMFYLFRMLPSIYFDNQTFLETHKIHNIAT